jgi:uncharacterized protein
MCHFLVGLSLDGPEHVHDHYRVAENGAGSFRKASDAARLLLDAGVEVNALLVVNAWSVDFPEEVYGFLKSQGFTWMQFIPCANTGAAGTDARGMGEIGDPRVAPEPYGRFLCRLFDLWLADFVDGKPTTSIRLFESLLLSCAGLPPGECTLAKECGNYVVVEHDGSVYPCDFFVQTGWRLGNLLETPLPALMDSTMQAGFGRMKSELPADCLDCEWVARCHGGCTRDRPGDQVGNGTSYLCDAYRIFFPHADSRLQSLADSWNKGWPRVETPTRRRVG